jgi:hypothetical protein
LTPGEVVTLLVVAQSAQEQREADKAVHHDHNNGEHRVAGERWICFASQHHRTNSHDLDTADAERQDQRAVRFARYDGELVRIGDHHQGADDNGAEEPQEDRNAYRRAEAGRQQLVIEEEEKPGGAKDEEERQRRASHRRCRLRRGCSHLV